LRGVAGVKTGRPIFFNVWDRIEANEFAHVVTEAAASVFPGDPPSFLARTPHGCHDTATIRDEVQAAGFTEFELTTLEHASEAPSPRHPAIAYCQGTPLRSEIEARDASRLAEVTDRASEAIAARFGDGPVNAKIRAHVVTAARAGA
jgi:hypothetical protein